MYLVQRIFKRFLIYWRILLLKVRYYLFGIEAVNEELLRTTIGAFFILRSFGASIGGGSVIHSPLIIHNAERDYSKLLIFVSKDSLISIILFIKVFICYKSLMYLSFSQVFCGDTLSYFY